MRQVVSVYGCKIWWVASEYVGFITGASFQVRFRYICLRTALVLRAVCV